MLAKNLTQTFQDLLYPHIFGTASKIVALLFSLYFSMI